MKNEVNTVEESVSDSASEQKREKKQRSEHKVDGVVRIKLPSVVGIKAREIVAELKARGEDVTIDELFSKYLESIPERYFEDQLLQRTPEPYYLEAAAKVPELREMLIRHAKKGLMRNALQDAPPRELQRRKRKADGVETSDNQTQIPNRVGD